MKEINQKIEYVHEYKLWDFEKAIQEKTSIFNNDGYELTALSTNGSGDYSDEYSAILVFTKKCNN